MRGIMLILVLGFALQGVGQHTDTIYTKMGAQIACEITGEGTDLFS